MKNQRDLHAKKEQKAPKVLGSAREDVRGSRLIDINCRHCHCFLAAVGRFSSAYCPNCRVWSFPASNLGQPTERPVQPSDEVRQLARAAGGDAPILDGSEGRKTRSKARRGAVKGL